MYLSCAETVRLPKMASTTATVAPAAAAVARTLPVGTSSLAPLLHHEPAALLGVEVECLHGGGLSCCLILGDHAPKISGGYVPEILAALADQRDAPTPELGRLCAEGTGLKLSNAEGTSPTYSASMNGVRQNRLPIVTYLSST